MRTAVTDTVTDPRTRMATATTYSYIDANGVRNFSNRRPRGVANVTVSRISYPVFQMETCYACGVQPGVNFGTTRLNTTAYKDEIAQAALTYGVDEAVIRAIIHAESAFRPTALSRVGAQGLMQLMPATARRFGVADAYDAAQNIRGGVQYLAWLLKRYGGDLKLAAPHSSLSISIYPRFPRSERTLYLGVFSISLDTIDDPTPDAYALTIIQQPADPASITTDLAEPTGPSPQATVSTNQSVDPLTPSIPADSRPAWRPGGWPSTG